MTYYFAPPVPGLASDVTLVNEASRDTPGVWRGEQIVHAAWSDGQVWHTLALARLGSGERITISSTNMPAGMPNDALPVLFLDSQDHTGASADLPIITHMESVPAWRANIRLRSATTAVSYQGEYPTAMTRAREPTLLSIGPLIQAQNGIRTELILINITRAATIREFELRIYSAEHRCLIAQSAVRTNRCSVVPLTEMDGTQIVTCVGMTGIPLYLSYDAPFAHMSLEHTHPPLEGAVFGNRVALSQRMKAAWFRSFTP